MTEVYMFLSLMMIWTVTLIVSFIIGLNYERPKSKNQIRYSAEYLNEIEQKELDNFMNYNGTPQEQINE